MKGRGGQGKPKGRLNAGGLGGSGGREGSSAGGRVRARRFEAGRDTCRRVQIGWPNMSADHFDDSIAEITRRPGRGQLGRGLARARSAWARSCVRRASRKRARTHAKRTRGSAGVTTALRAAAALAEDKHGDHSAKAYRSPLDLHGVSFRASIPKYA